jgi:hypothetical protein
MKYGPKAHEYETENIFESIILFNEEMEAETGLEFPQALTCTFSQTKEELAPERLFWWLIALLTGKSILIGQYLSNDGDFMKRYLQAHRKAFSPMLIASGWKTKQIENEYLRWHNRAMRGLEGNLTQMQDAYEGEA